MSGGEPPLPVPPPGGRRGRGFDFTPLPPPGGGDGGEGGAARRSPFLAAALFALLLLAAGPAAAQEARIVGERGGWLVEAYTIPLGETGEIRYCVASRPQDPPPRLGFMTTRATVGLLIDLGPPELEAGGTYALEIAVDGAGGVRRPARPVTPTILGLMESGTDVSAMLAPYARGRTVAVRVPALGPEAWRVSLAGSSWAVQTLGTCRSDHVE